MNFGKNNPPSIDNVQAIPYYQIVYPNSNTVTNQNQNVFSLPINPPPYSSTHPVPSAPPMPIELSPVPVTSGISTNKSKAGQDQGFDDEIFKRNILYPLERSLFKLLQDNEFGLYPSIRHITILENKSCKITLGVFFVKLHLEIASENNSTLVSHCIHVRVRKNMGSYQLERVLPNMTETDELSFLSAKNK